MPFQPLSLDLLCGDSDMVQTKSGHFDCHLNPALLAHDYLGGFPRLALGFV